MYMQDGWKRQKWRLRKNWNGKVIIVRYWCKIMLKALTGEASKGYKRKKIETERSKIMDKYS